MGSFTPRKPCIHPGCPALIVSGARCDEHKKMISNGYDRARGSAAQRGYDAAWQAVRLRALKRDGYLCQDCLLEGRMVPAEAVDHVERFSGIKDPKRLDLKNLRSLCWRHHSIKTAKYDGSFGRARKQISD